jgi:hypothetical protein
MDKLIKFCGYFDSSVIYSGFLIPVYTDSESFYFHKISEDSKITDFTKIDMDSYKNDSISPIDEYLPAKVGGESYIVVKSKNKIKFGKYSEMADHLYSEIETGSIDSKVLIDNIKKNIKKEELNIRVINDHIASVMNIKK